MAPVPAMEFLARAEGVRTAPAAGCACFVDRDVLSGEFSLGKAAARLARRLSAAGATLGFFGRMARWRSSEALAYPADFVGFLRCIPACKHACLWQYPIRTGCFHGGVVPSWFSGKVSCR